MTSASAPAPAPQNFVDHLQALAATRPDDTALVVVGEQDGMPAERSFTYRVFAQRVRALAARLQARCAPGERALVMLENDEHYAAAMLACFHAGVIAVPVFPPESTRAQHLGRLAGIAADAQARVILTTQALQGLVDEAAARLGAPAVMAVDTVDPGEAAAWVPHRPAGEAIAFLQYTSGSTSAPKGVMVSHANLMANERAIHEGLGIGPDDRFGTWSPLFHDMGLIGGLLQPFYSGIACVLTSPRFFLERPLRWLELVSRHRVTVSGGPDFAYRLCLDRIKDAQLQGLDLSCWRVAYTGAEPVRHDTMAAFTARFAPAGFRAAAVYPCYGLAEATLFVTGGQRGQGMVAPRFRADRLAQGLAVPADPSAQDDDTTKTLVGCGRVPSGHALAIVDAQTGRPLPAGRIGEIRAGGPSIAAGYWGNQQATAQTFVQDGDTRWLRTGDLGFVHEGHLYVAGRLKDMIIVRGHNLYPQDIERAVEAGVEAVRAGRVAAFAVELEDGTEGIGVAAEVSRGMQKLVPPQALVDALNAAVSELCGEPLRVAVLLNPGGLPRTSSGKLQRAACRQGVRERTLDAYALFEGGRFVLGAAGTGHSVDAPVDDTTQALAGLWREVLGHDAARRYAGDAHFFGLGGSSLSAVQLAARIAGLWEIDFPVRQVFEQPRLNDQAAAVRRAQAGGRRAAPAAIPALPPEQRREGLPLSHAQQRQWFLWQLAPGGNAYHVSLVLRLRGPLRADALQAAAGRLLERHETLCTVFRAAADGTPAQWILPAGPADLPVIDLRETPAGERDALAIAQAQRLHDQPFDLARGPLLRLVLMRTADHEHLLAVVAHHIVSDGVSMQLLVNELAALYAAQLQGTAVPLAAPALQYADHAAWQRSWLAAGESARQLAWWRNQLGDAQAVLTLPTDHPRPPEPAYRAQRHAIGLPADLLERLRGLAQARGATLFMVQLAALQALLHRWTGHGDIRVGVPVAGRVRTEAAAMIGLFVNTVVLRNVMHGRTSLAQVLDHAREAALGAQAHQDLPFEQLVEALQPQRSASHHPLFQVMFNHQREQASAFSAMPGLTLQRLAPLQQAAQFELVLDTIERADGSVEAGFVYAAELFEPATIERLAGHYVALLQALAAQPGMALGDVDLLAPAERSQLALWGEAVPSPDLGLQGGPVHRLFEHHARTRPDATALLFDDQALNYAELNARANRLAHQLVALGVRPESRVGIAAERSVEMIVALLAVLKAGAAYVPLDPELPPGRLAYMAADSGIALLLAQARLMPLLQPVLQPLPPVLLLDEAATQDTGTDTDANPAVPLHAEHLAYVIYTSGSTGRPKGAAVRHGSLSLCMRWMQHTYQLSHPDTVLHKAPFGFDVSVWEIFWPLSCGARLVLARPGDQRDPARIVHLIRQHQVTTLNFVPAMLQAFLAHPGIEAHTRLRHVICGGEAMPSATQREALQRLHGVTLQNLYGPTETTIHVTQWTCRDDGRPLVPIGRPIAGVVARVLDAGLNLLPAGVPGELYLGGALLGRGYLHRPGLTAERFVADPFDPAGGRLYRTGDLVRWNAEGQLEYLGRIDHQVKIRGLRIELGEVEATLLALPGLREAVVVAREGPAGAPIGTRLVAYVSALPGHSVDAHALRQQLALSLPDYMVPGAFVALPALPLNANGKVDRNALPEPELASGGSYAAPQGQVEQALAALWAGELGLPRVGVHDNFFDLGGHSLLLVRVHRLMEEQLHTGLPLVDLFRFPTIASLARHIAQGGAPTAPSDDGDARAQRKRAALRQRRARTTETSAERTA
jgi:amino acid adenylation domain-containing protein